MRARTHFKTHFVSLVSVVQSKCVRPFFTSTESQESKSDIARQCSILDYCYAVSVPELVIADAKLVLSKVVTRTVDSVGLQVVLCVCVY